MVLHFCRFSFSYGYIVIVSDTPYNSASTWSGNPVKFLKTKAITGFLGEKAVCLPMTSPLTQALELKGIYKILLWPLI